MNVQCHSRHFPAPANVSSFATRPCDIHPRAPGKRPCTLHGTATDRGICKPSVPPLGGYQKWAAYRRAKPNASRRDAYPPECGRSGHVHRFMQKKKAIDSIEQKRGSGILNPTGDNGQSYPAPGSLGGGSATP